MTSVSIIRSEDFEGPGDKGILLYRKQQKRKDPEAMILKRYQQLAIELGPKASEEEVIEPFCEELGRISIDQFIHKLEIFYGMIEDDEKEWREKKYGKH